MILGFWVGCAPQQAENISQSNNELPVQDIVFSVTVDNITSTSVIVSFVDTDKMTQHNYRLWLGSQNHYSYWSDFIQSSKGRYFSKPTYLKPQQKYFFEIREGNESYYKGSFTTESEAHDIAMEISSVFPCKTCENDIVKARQLMYSAMKSRHYPTSGLIGEERTKMYDAIALLESCISEVTPNDCTQEVKDITVSAMMNDIGYCHTFFTE